MTHRTEIVGLPLTASLTEALRIVEEERFTRIPVYDQVIDNIVGILHVKDLIHLINDSDAVKEFNLRDNIRKPFFISVHKKIDEVFVDLQSTGTHFAIVLDEYGGTGGILTLEDLLEEIVGNILDEDDEIEFELKKIDENSYEVNGLIELDKLEIPLDVELPVDEFDTLSGFLISLLGRIPAKGDTVEIKYKHFANGDR